MNNNRNNRRRGRGNNRSQGGGQLNRIDSRARGNAPQLLEKYKKLAHDASMNGDRVQAEYYLQFADHYFRVMADTRTRQDEQRARRDEGRDRPEGSEDDRDDYPRNADYAGRQSADDCDDDGADEGSEFEPEQNPFTRSNRERAPRRAPRKPRNEAPERNDDAPQGMDPSVLPPSISTDKVDGDKEEKPRRRARAKKAVEDDGGEELAKAS